MRKYCDIQLNCHHGKSRKRICNREKARDSRDMLYKQNVKALGWSSEAIATLMFCAFDALVLEIRTVFNKAGNTIHNSSSFQAYKYFHYSHKDASRCMCVRI